MICKINYTDNPEGKIDEIIDCHNVGETGNDYYFRDAFGELIVSVPKEYVETIVIG